MREEYGIGCYIKGGDADIHKMARCLADNVQEEIDEKIKREKERARKGAESQFAHEYLTWLKANTVKNPRQAILQFCKKKGIEINEQ